MQTLIHLVPGSGDVPLSAVETTQVEASGARTTRHVSPQVAAGFVRFADFTVLFAAGCLGAHGLVDGAMSAQPLLIATSVLISAAFVVLVNGQSGYSIKALSSSGHDVAMLTRAWVGAIAFGCALLLVMQPSPLSFAWAAAFFAIGGVAAVVTRVVAAVTIAMLVRSGHLVRRAVVYGGGEVSAGLLPELAAEAGVDVQVDGYFDDREGRVPTVLSGVPRLGGLGELLGYARQNRVDLIILALPINAEARVATLLRALSVLPVDIKLPAAATKIGLTRRSYSYLGPVAMIDLADKPIADWGGLGKRVFDLSVAAAVLFALTPVMAMIAAAVAYDSRGPVLFRQKRYGFNNELIEVLKFRSMFAEQSDGHAARLVTRGDDRVTRVGRFLRKTSLDELPQLLNVLKGELSLVGPRPHALKAKAAQRFYDDAVEGYFARHKVKPGMTGWAQINGWRGETDTLDKIEQRVAHDIHYIENWSIWFDIRILLRTPMALFKADNAF